jgi:hypothetical protein
MIVSAFIIIDNVIKFLGGLFLNIEGRAPKYFWCPSLENYTIITKVII